MKEFADSAYVHAKICGLYSGLLSRSDYRALLAGSAFNLYFPGLPSNPPAADCTAFKERLFRRSITGVLVLAEALAAYRYLFAAFLRLFEARNVKLLLARALGSVPPDRQWYDISPYAAFSPGDLDLLQDWKALQRLMQKTYLSQLCQCADRPRFEILESRLDLECLESFFYAARCLPADDRLIIQESVLMRLALLKVLWPWRLARYYGWEIAQAREQMNTAIQDTVLIDDCLRRGRPHRFEQSLRQACPAGQHNGMAEPLFEQYAEGLFYAYVRGLAARDFHSIACVAGYLWLLYYQIRNLFLLLDGIRFSLPAHTLDTMLICEASPCLASPIS